MAMGVPARIRACLFDLDGVLTDTASVHLAAWTQMFDEFLAGRSGLSAEAARPFSDDDYRRHVDGRIRSDGTRAFLSSRGIVLPEGRPDDPPEADTVHGLGNRKNARFLDRLAADGVQTFPDGVALLRGVRTAGLKCAVVSASANTAQVLDVTGLAGLVDLRVDGVIAGQRHLAGKPAPDTFLAAADGLSVAPSEAAVFEDAVAGVQAGRAGEFGFVVGVDRVGDGHADELRRAGADAVVSDLRRLAEAQP